MHSCLLVFVSTSKSLFVCAFGFFVLFLFCFLLLFLFVVAVVVDWLFVLVSFCHCLRESVRASVCLWEGGGAEGGKEGGGGWGLLACVRAGLCTCMYVSMCVCVCL